LLNRKAEDEGEEGSDTVNVSREKGRVVLSQKLFMLRVGEINGS
jgi:hypothetical protein